MNITHGTISYVGPRGATFTGSRSSIAGENIGMTSQQWQLETPGSGSFAGQRCVASQALGGIWQGVAGQSPFGEKESFEASIHGDPHFAMNGQVNGQEVDSKFDNQDLGRRTQIAGAGFRLETETVPWGNNGAAVVGSSTVTTGFGRNQDQVTVNANGTVSVNGQTVNLEEGQTMQLNNTSSLSMSDGKITVSSRNGKVSNTFTPHEHENGDYLNIDTSVDGVQTGGWFQQQATA